MGLGGTFLLGSRVENEYQLRRGFAAKAGGPSSGYECARQEYLPTLLSTSWWVIVSCAYVGNYSLTRQGVR